MNDWISTETLLPPFGAIVEHRVFSNDKPQRAIFVNSLFQNSRDGRMGTFACFNGKAYGPWYGHWRYVDTPGEEKRDSGHPRAFTGRSPLEYQYALLASKYQELEEMLDDAEEEIKDEKGNYLTLAGEYNSLQAHASNLERIISGQRKALASKEDEIGCQQDEIDHLWSLINGLKLSLAEYENSDKMTQLEKDGWISADKEMPPEYATQCEVMKDGQLLTPRVEHGFDYVWGNLATRQWSTTRGWTDMAGTYWRPKSPWIEATPENLANVKAQNSLKPINETWEVKLQDGSIAEAFFTTIRDEWHVIGDGCSFLKPRIQRDVCANVSTQGTYFRKLARK